MSEEEKGTLTVLKSQVTPAQIRQEAIEAFKSLGFTAVTEQQCQELIKLGVHVREEGILNHQRGVSMFNQHALMDAIGGIKGRLQEELRLLVTGGGKRLRKGERLDFIESLVKMTTQLSKCLTESQEVMLELSGGIPAIQTGSLPEKLQKAFSPGSDVKGGTLVVANNVQINEPHKNSP